MCTWRRSEVRGGVVSAEALLFPREKATHSKEGPKTRDGLVLNWMFRVAVPQNLSGSIHYLLYYLARIVLQYFIFFPLL